MCAIILDYVRSCWVSQVDAVVIMQLPLSSILVMSLFVNVRGGVVANFVGVNSCNEYVSGLNLNCLPCSSLPGLKTVYTTSGINSDTSVINLVFLLPIASNI